MGTDAEHKTGVVNGSVAGLAGTFRLGIEEEYFLVDAETKAIAPTVPEALFTAAKTSTLGRGKCEFLQQQVEVATEPHVDMVKARVELRQLRHTLAAIAAPHGLAILAAGTHPTAVWTEAQQTKGERYDAVMHDLQMIGKRNMLCGLHVHVELPDPDARVDVMTRMLPYLPIFIALATSSPFWRSRRTGLLGYRLAAYDELPRTGVPELFRTRAEFEAYVDTLVRAGVMPDASFIWWAMRPSIAHPTLELRAPDCCTRLEDTLAIAALYRTLARRVFFNPWLNADLTAVSRAVVVENKWRAQRYGIHGTFVDEGRPREVPFARWLDQVIEEAAGDAAALGCLDEVLRCRAIVADGTSADAQLTVYRQARDKGAEREEALAAVSEWLAETTLGRDGSAQHLRARTPYLHPGTAGARTYPDRPVLHVLRPAEATAVYLDRELTTDLPVTASGCLLPGGPHRSRRRTILQCRARPRGIQASHRHPR
ncbi:MAG: carboxylate-amine ligase [Xanthobacteraceae bacterium]|jgi:carboxylate-amine ligase